jgi:hypothetical protein
MFRAGCIAPGNGDHLGGDAACKALCRHELAVRMQAAQKSI